MSSRRENHHSRLDLKNDIREQCRSGALLPGTPAPALRDLSEKYGVSTWMVTKGLQELIEEGLLHTIPRVGTFVGTRQSESENYLMLEDSTALSGRNLQFWLGFEGRIAQLGGASFKMSSAQLASAVSSHDLPMLRGIFEMNWLGDELRRHNELQSVVARARFSYSQIPITAQGADCDTIAFDDAGGGRQATQHLLSLGHTRIAFLGLHAANNAQETRFSWSKSREDGWREAMTQAALTHDDLSFDALNNAEEIEIERAYLSSQKMLARGDVSAVVAANDQAAIGLIRALKNAKTPRERWPAIVGFDDDPGAAEHLVTSLRLPWDEMGRAAADLLWERRHGRLPREAQHRLVPMRLIKRLTCRKDWSTAAGNKMVAVAP